VAGRDRRTYIELIPGLVALSIGDGVVFTTMFIAAATESPTGNKAPPPALPPPAQARAQLSASPSSFW
jgi:hypothetical protein